MYGLSMAQSYKLINIYTNYTSLMVWTHLRYPSGQWSDRSGTIASSPQSIMGLLEGLI